MTQVVAVRSVELAELKRVLATQMAKLPEARFDDSDAELMRFAIAAGILQVHQRSTDLRLSPEMPAGCICIMHCPSTPVTQRLA